MIKPLFASLYVFITLCNKALFSLNIVVILTAESTPILVKCIPFQSVFGVSLSGVMDQHGWRNSFALFNVFGLAVPGGMHAAL